MSDLSKCVLTDDGPLCGLQIGAVHVAIGHEPDGGWPSITVADSAGNKAHYSLGLTSKEREAHKNEVARLKAEAQRAEKLRDEARENIWAVKSALAEVRKDAAAAIERNKAILHDALKVEKREKEAKALAKSWKSKADYRDKKIAELRDALDQERGKPLIRLVSERAAMGFKRLIASLKGSA